MTNIKEDYVSYKTAKLLKKNGFDCDEISCIKVFKGHIYKIQDNVIEADENVTIPTIQMAMKWLREKHKITIGILFKGDRIYYEIHQNSKFAFGIYTSESYEKVCDKAIKYCLENLI